ncbi:hypothetical protein SDC9_171019 [bioreactor metagenome]|uniref:Uncharacterized protein n=1 Tax=bioreactor metagenome TaxID=1076179 RepID=A0A645GBX7_9ZZZZ
MVFHFFREDHDGFNTKGGDQIMILLILAHFFHMPGFNHVGQGAREIKEIHKIVAHDDII